MPMGRTYVPLTANSADIPSVLNISGGQTGGNYWLNWETSGFTGQGWYWDESGSYNYPIPNWWTTNHQGGTEHVTSSYTNDEDGFKDWLATENPGTLDFVLGTWTEGKLDFAINHGLYGTSCFSSN